MIDSKFEPLAIYLKYHNESQIVLSFEEIEAILNFRLCKSARKYSAYWKPSKTHMLPNICLDAGYKIEDVDLEFEKVRFVRLLRKREQT